MSEQPKPFPKLFRKSDTSENLVSRAIAYCNEVENWREEFVAWLQEELLRTQIRFPRWESELEKFQKKVLEVLGVE